MKGILFTPDNIKAIAEGRKTQTRRLFVEQPQCNGHDFKPLADRIGWKGYKHEGQTSWFCEVCGWGIQLVDEWSGHGILPRYLPGETVYVKEAYLAMPWGDVMYPLYLQKPAKPWQSPMFMPAKYARYILTIKDVRPERLQEISLGDLEKEGLPEHRFGIDFTSRLEDYVLRGDYQRLWDSINKNPSTRWADNPWAWRYVFSLIPRPETS